VIAAQIGEGQDCDRRLVREWQHRWSCCLGGGVANPVDAHRAGDVLDLLLAQILEEEGQPVAHLVMNRVGDEHRTGIGQSFDPCCDVDAVAVEVVALYDHVTEIDADAQFDAIVRPDAGVLLGHCLLHLDCAAHGIDNASKLHQ
jgi:hypothetical protein